MSRGETKEDILKNACDSGFLKSYLIGTLEGIEEMFHCRIPYLFMTLENEYGHVTVSHNEVRK